MATSQEFTQALINSYGFSPDYAEKLSGYFIQNPDMYTRFYNAMKQNNNVEYAFKAMQNPGYNYDQFRMDKTKEYQTGQAGKLGDKALSTASGHLLEEAPYIGAGAIMSKLPIKSLARVGKWLAPGKGLTGLAGNLGRGAALGYALQTGLDAAGATYDMATQEKGLKKKLDELNDAFYRRTGKQLKTNAVGLQNLTPLDVAINTGYELLNPGKLIATSAVGWGKPSTWKAMKDYGKSNYAPIWNRAAYNKQYQELKKAQPSANRQKLHELIIDKLKKSGQYAEGGLVSGASKLSPEYKKLYKQRYGKDIK